MVTYSTTFERPNGCNKMNEKASLAMISAILLSSLFYPCRASCEETTAPKTKNVLDGIERKIVKEPKYSSVPRYALLILGTSAESKVWLVEDGNLLYVDQNANGDLTDDGPPIPQSKVRQFQNDKGTARDCEYVLVQFQPLGAERQTNCDVRRWNYGDKEDQYGLSLTLDGRTPMYAGWFGTFWASSPEKTPLVHFGGPLKPITLRFKEFVLGSTLDRLSIAFVNEGSGEGATSRLSIEAYPNTWFPKFESIGLSPMAHPHLRSNELLICAVAIGSFTNKISKFLQARPKDRPHSRSPFPTMFFPLNFLRTKSRFPFGRKRRMQRVNNRGLFVK